MTPYRRAFLEAPYGSGIDVSVAGPDRDKLRINVRQAIARTGIWDARIYASTRIFLNPSPPIVTSDLAQREYAVGILLDAIESRCDDVRGVSLVDWIFARWALPEPAGMGLMRAVWDERRTVELDRLRVLALGPWLSGQRRVRNLEVFRAFHTALSPQDRFILRIVSYWYRHGAGATAGAPGSPISFITAEATLEQAGWVEREFVPASGRTILIPGLNLRHMAAGQGELLRA